MIELIVILAMFSGLLWFTYNAGSKSETADNNEEVLDAIDKATKARDSIKSADDARRLLLEHAVQDVPSVQDPKTNNE